MLYSANDILGFLSKVFSNIRFLETEPATTGRFREKHVIIFTYNNVEGRECVLKFFVLQHIEPGRRQQEMSDLLQEYNTIRSFGDHPGVVRVFSTDELLWDGQLIGLYITMERFDSVLSDLIIEHNKFNTKQVESFLNQMDNVLSYAHYQMMQPIVHSDIKPANIGVRWMKGGYEFALMDFDVSVALERKNSDESSFTLTNRASMRGITLAYAPPEQVLAYLHRSGNISNRVDIYAVGAIAMQMLTGLPPRKDPDRMYYLLPWHEVPSDWVPVFDIMCAPEASKRCRMVSEGLNLKGQKQSSKSGEIFSHNPDMQTLLIKNPKYQQVTLTLWDLLTPLRKYSSYFDSIIRLNTKWPGIWFGVAIIFCVVILAYLILIQTTNGNISISQVSLRASLENVEIRTTPADVQLWVDGEQIGVSNQQGIWQGQIRTGNRILELRRQGFQPQVRSIDVRQNQTNVFHLSLDHVPARLSVRTNPPEASIEIGGQQYQSNSFIPLQPGIHSLRISQDGYQQADTSSSVICR
jgi:serine/threonine protein kinase